MTSRKCGRCKKFFTASSKHKCCSKCRYVRRKRICPICRKSKTQYDRCRACANRARIGTGNGWLTEDGYEVVSVGVNPTTGKSIPKLKHRMVMEQLLGRALLPGETVHHKNGIRTDNNPANLELWVTLQPSGQRPVDLLVWADEIIRRYRVH